MSTGTYDLEAIRRRIIEQVESAAVRVTLHAQQESVAMKCSIAGCPGEYEAQTIAHTVRHHGRLIVIDHVPAEVCSICGDVLLAPDTVRHIEAILRSSAAPVRSVPLYEFA